MSIMYKRAQAETQIQHMLIMTYCRYLAQNNTLPLDIEGHSSIHHPTIFHVGVADETVKSVRFQD